MSYFIKKNMIHVKNNVILIDNTIIPLDEENLLLKFSKDKYPFHLFSFAELLDASIKNSKKQSSNIKKNFFRGKTVFIGLTAPGLFDLKPTPMSSKTPGVFIHATTFENLINKNFIKVHQNPSFFQSC